MERNLTFDTGEKVKLSSILLSEELKVATSKKPMMTPSIALLVLSIPVCDLLSQLSGKGQIQEIIESNPEHNSIDLRLSQRLTIGPSEQAPPSRSERIHLQYNKNLPSGLVTRSQARRDTGDYFSTLVYKINEDNHLEHSGINLSQ